MKNTLLLIFVACLLSGCSSLTPTSKSLQGEWCFAYVQKAQSMFGEMPPPPRFDSIRFSREKKINLKDSLTKKEFEGTFDLTENDLEYSFQPPELNEPVRHKLVFSLLDKGEVLVLTHDQTEMVYYRADRFYPNSLAGEWVTTKGDQTETMKLGEDGSYQMVESQVLGHYRLWPSRYGMAMTASMFIPDHGTYMIIWMVQRQGKRVTLTPVSYDGPMKDAAIVWTKK